jgi:predicted GNAT family acetyltransferase
VNNPEVRVNEAGRRFEIQLDGETAYIDYRWHHETLVLLYVYVPMSHRGKGISNILIEFAMRYARENQVKLKVYCSYINGYLRRHPEHHELLSQE